MVVETGCTACDGPAESLQRSYRLTDGTYRVDELFRARWRSTNTNGMVDCIHTYAVSGDASQMIVGVCTKPGCEWYDGWLPTAEVTLYRRPTAGLRGLPGSTSVAAILPDGLLLSRATKNKDGEAVFSFVKHPSGEKAASPVKGTAASQSPVGMVGSWARGWKPGEVYLGP